MSEANLRRGAPDAIRKANRTDMEGEPKSDASTIEEQCAGVVEQRFDEAVEFSALTRNPYNRRL